MLAHTGATRSQLIYWTDAELITPDVTETAGTGHHRAFSFRNLIQVKIATLLAPRGLSVQYRWPLFFAPCDCPPAPLGTGNRLDPDRRDESHAVWTGSATEFPHELRHRVAGGGLIGIVIKLNEVVDGLREKTAG